MESVAEPLARIPGVVAVALGGSRAQGTHRPDSDWDFALYYRGDLDTDAIRALGWPGTITEPGAWAYPMNGGAWLTIQGVKVDLLYRDLDDVERWLARTTEGDWELYRVPGYLAGMPSYTLVAELALGRVLSGRCRDPCSRSRSVARRPPGGGWRRTLPSTTQASMHGEAIVPPVWASAPTRSSPLATHVWPQTASGR